MGPDWRSAFASSGGGPSTRRKQMRKLELAGRRPNLPLAAAAALLLCGQAAWAQTYTLDGDFNMGTLTGVNESVPNQLQLDAVSPPPKYIYVAQPDEGILLKMDTATGKQVARYETTLVIDCPGCPGVG